MINATSSPGNLAVNMPKPRAPAMLDQYSKVVQQNLIWVASYASHFAGVKNWITYFVAWGKNLISCPTLPPIEVFDGSASPLLSSSLIKPFGMFATYLVPPEASPANPLAPSPVATDNARPAVGAELRSVTTWTVSPPADAAAKISVSLTAPYSPRTIPPVPPNPHGTIPIWQVGQFFVGLNRSEMNPSLAWNCF